MPEDHRIERARERYGVDLTKGDIRLLEQQIIDRKSVVMRRLANDTEEHLVRHGKLIMVVVWAHARDGSGRSLIATFLPIDAYKAGTQVSRMTVRRNTKVKRGKNEARRDYEDYA